MDLPALRAAYVSAENAYASAPTPENAARANAAASAYFFALYG